MAALQINGREILPGETANLELPVANLYTGTPVSIPIHVKHGRQPGPRIFVSAAVHGDELNGVEIIRRLIARPSLKIKQGVLILVPMVNVYGVLNQSRYMPDRRDLNRSFPGSAKGSLAARTANQFVESIVKHCDYGIDLHTGAIHRSNLPQIRADLEDTQTAMLAKSFGVPVLLNGSIVEGTLRKAAVDAGTKVLLYEAGEALRFDELSIRVGVRGVLNVLAELAMISQRKKIISVDHFIADRTAWVRAMASGLVINKTKLGRHVEQGQVLAEISDSYGRIFQQVIAPKAGIVIGQLNIPLVQEGEAMYHLAYFSENEGKVADNIEQLQDNILPEAQLL